MSSSSPLQQLDTDLFVAECPLRFVGLEVGARMTIVRLPGPRLLLYSPIAVTDELVESVKELGPVAHIVAPNRLHHLFVSDWQQRFPEASTYVAPGLDTKRPDLAIDGVLGDDPEPGWRDEIDQVFVRGWPFANEVVFFHRASATLILSDLAFNIGPSSPLLTRLAFRLYGAYGRLTPTFFERLLVRDKAGFRESLERILTWPIERVVVAHGRVVEKGGREQLAAGYSWIVGDGRTV